MDPIHRSGNVLATGVRTGVLSTFMPSDGCLGVEELGPGHIGAVRGRVDVVVGEDLPDGGLGDGVSESGEFALDASVSPCRVLGGESHDQFAQFRAGWWSALPSLGWLGPVAGDTTTVPSQQRLGCHDPALAKRAGECGSDGSEKDPVVVVDRWSLDLTA